MKFKNILSEEFRPDDDYLYHVTHRDKLDEIRNRGLVPKFGDLVKRTGGYDFWREYLEDGSLPSSAENIDGVIFFSEEPHIHYYDVDSREHTKDVVTSEILVCVVEKNDSIYHYVNHGKGQVENYKGRVVHKVRWWGGNSIRAEYIPFFIEPGDWFSFEAQIPEKLLYDEELYDFLKKYYPEKLSD